MAVIREDQESFRKVPYEPEQHERDEHLLAWVQKYLDLANLFLKRTRQREYQDRIRRKAA